VFLGAIGSPIGRERTVEGEYSTWLTPGDDAERPVDGSFFVPFDPTPELRARTWTCCTVQPFSRNGFWAEAADLRDVADQGPHIRRRRANSDGR
jgi:hypothetical protein